MVEDIAGKRNQYRGFGPRFAILAARAIVEAANEHGGVTVFLCAGTIGCKARTGGRYPILAIGQTRLELATGTMLVIGGNDGHKAVLN